MVLLNTVCTSGNIFFCLVMFALLEGYRSTESSCSSSIILASWCLAKILLRSYHIVSGIRVWLKFAALYYVYSDLTFNPLIRLNNLNMFFFFSFPESCLLWLVNWPRSNSPDYLDSEARPSSRNSCGGLSLTIFMSMIRTVVIYRGKKWHISLSSWRWAIEIALFYEFSWIFFLFPGLRVDFGPIDRSPVFRGLLRHKLFVYCQPGVPSHLRDEFDGPVRPVAHVLKKSSL